jgi:hypothetical protein
MWGKYNMGIDTKAPFILRIQMNYILLKLEGATNFIDLFYMKAHLTDAMRTLSFDTFSEH